MQFDASSDTMWYHEKKKKKKKKNSNKKVLLNTDNISLKVDLQLLHFSVLAIR